MIQDLKESPFKRYQQKRRLANIIHCSKGQYARWLIEPWTRISPAISNDLLFLGACRKTEFIGDYWKTPKLQFS